MTRLGTDLSNRLNEIVGPMNWTRDPTDLAHFGKLSPLVVAWPESTDQAATLLRLGCESKLKVAISGQGSRAKDRWPSLKGTPCIVISTARMRAIKIIDHVSLTVHTQCGISVEHLEGELNREGLTLGPFPFSILNHSSVGGLLSAPPSMLFSPQFGHFIDGCLGLSAVRADGIPIRIKAVPRRAAGPSTLRMFMDTQGTVGVMTECILRVFRSTTPLVSAGYLFPSIAAATAVAKRMMQAMCTPTQLRILCGATGADATQDPLQRTSAVMICEWMGARPLIEEQRRTFDHNATLGAGKVLPREEAARYWLKRPTERALNREARPRYVHLSYSAFAKRAGEFENLIASDDSKRRLHLLFDQFSRHGCYVWIWGKPEKAVASLTKDLDSRDKNKRILNRRPGAALLEELDPDQILVSPLTRRSSPRAMVRAS